MNDDDEYVEQWMRLGDALFDAACEVLGGLGLGLSDDLEAEDVVDQECAAVAERILGLFRADFDICECCLAPLDLL